MKRFGAALATVVLLAAAVLLSRNADQAGEDDAQDAAQTAPLSVDVHPEARHALDRVRRIVLLDRVEIRPVAPDQLLRNPARIDRRQDLVLDAPQSPVDPVRRPTHHLINMGP